jgi:hypothetical protein
MQHDHRRLLPLLHGSNRALHTEHTDTKPANNEQYSKRPMDVSDESSVSMSSVWDFSLVIPFSPVHMSFQINTVSRMAHTSCDAIVASARHFVGGTGSSGVLVAQRRLLHEPSRGEVVDLMQYLQQYDMMEDRSEAQIASSVRAGLVFRLRDLVSPLTLRTMAIENCKAALTMMEEMPNVLIMGAPALEVARKSPSLPSMPLPHVFCC